MDINYREMAERAAAYAKKSNIDLDFSKSSLEKVDEILFSYHEHLNEYEGEEGEDTLWNIAVHFGIYVGETMLNVQLKDQGYQWCISDGIPIIKNESNVEMSPVTKAHKMILNGPEDSVKSFCNVAFSIANGDFPTQNVLRAVDVKLASGKEVDNVRYRDMESYIMLIEEGLEDFLILTSHDGYLQFYGMNNQYVAEIRVNLKDDDFRTYSIIN